MRATNARSAAAAKAENSIGQALHAMDYMVYADLQLARDADALAVVKDALGLSSPDIAAAYARAAIPARYAVEREQWREAAALPDPAASKFPYIEAMTLFARAVGAARSGDPGAAEKDVARLAAVADALKAANNGYWATEVEAQRRGAAAWIVFTGGKRDEALGLMRAAADLEDASEKSGISPGRICRRASFWATCSSKAAASTKRLPLTKRLWSMTKTLPQLLRRRASRGSGRQSRQGALLFRPCRGDDRLRQRSSGAHESARLSGGELADRVGWRAGFREAND